MCKMMKPAYAEAATELKDKAVWKKGGRGSNIYNSIIILDFGWSGCDEAGESSRCN